MTAASTPRQSSQPAAIATRPAMLLSIYSLTPTHCGTGQVSGAVDLPIARETHTAYPVLPAQSLKGALRAGFEPDEGAALGGKNVLLSIFGPELAGPAGGAPDEERDKRDRRDSGNDPGKGLRVGTLTFGEGQLLLYPVRALSRLFLRVTSPLALERLARNLVAFGLAPALAEVCRKAAGHVRNGASTGDSAMKNVKETVCWVADPSLAGHTLVLEDLAYAAGDVQHSAAITNLAKAIATLVVDTPRGGDDRAADGLAAADISRNLVVIGNEEFTDLVERVVPVHARVKLNDCKTTDTNPDNGEKGNLWYEESLPPDCLFTAVITARPNATQRGQTAGRSPAEDLSALHAAFESTPVVQVGGNETVGQGFCLMKSFRSEEAR